MKKRKTISALPWLFHKTKRQLPGVLVLALLNGILAYSYIQLALLSERLIDAAAVIMQDPPASFWGCLQLPAIAEPVCYVMGVIVLQLVLYIVCTNIRVRVTGNLEIGLRQTVFSSLLGKEYEQFHRYHSGELLNRLTADVNHVVSGVSGLIPAAVSLVTRLVACLVVLTRLSPAFTAAVVILGVLILSVTRIYGRYTKRLHKQFQETDGATRSFMQESLENLLSVKAFSNEPYMEERLRDYQKEHYRVRLKRNTAHNFGHLLMYLVLTAVYYLALIWGVICLIAGTLSFGALTALLQIFDQLKIPLRNTSALLPQYYSMIASAERLQELEQLPAEATALTAEQRAYLKNTFSGLRAQDVGFAYNGEDPTLNEVTLVIPKGEITALVGESGAGKSTFMKLLLAILYPTSGQLSVEQDGVSYPLGADTRCLFSYVPQGNTVFAGTLRENVAFFRTEISDSQITRALELACLGDFLSTLPDGLDTPVGEHGFDLSEGQAQRVAIARALLTDAPVLLLDECTSALDSETETQLLTNLKRLTEKTVLLISHRDTTVEGSDRIFRVENGTIRKIK